jgi:hypothetical protein
MHDMRPKKKKKKKKGKLIFQLETEREASQFLKTSLSKQ